uniref:Retrotransposon Copia-like N-terminal domain-containing protein n=1 Tax=Cannabis sativa TaxID=3483 RepID=A0A803NJ74_CANSA
MTTGEQTSSGAQGDGSAPVISKQHASVQTVASSSQSQSSGVVVPQFGSTLNQPFALKLDDNNFSLWKTIVSAIARGHMLDGFLTGAKARP